jgi:hypothetical protein
MISMRVEERKEGRNSHEVWKDDAILECRCNPYQVERVLVYPDKVCKS